LRQVVSFGHGIWSLIEEASASSVAVISAIKVAIQHEGLVMRLVPMKLLQFLDDGS